MGYLEAAALVDYLVGKYGWTGFLKFYHSMEAPADGKQSEAMDTALKANLEVSFDELETEFTAALRSVLDLDIPFSDAQGWEAVKEGLQTASTTLRHLPVLLKYGTTTIRQFASKFKDPALVTAFYNFVHFGGPDVPLLTVLLPLAYAHRKMAGIPAKGWLSFARAIERRFVELGGHIRYRAKAERLLVENGTARGVRLANGSQLPADRVLSAADGRFSQSLFLGKNEGETASSAVLSAGSALATMTPHSSSSVAASRSGPRRTSPRPMARA